MRAHTAPLAGAGDDALSIYIIGVIHVVDHHRRQ